LGLQNFKPVCFLLALAIVFAAGLFQVLVEEEYLDWHAVEAANADKESDSHFKLLGEDKKINKYATEDINIKAPLDAVQQYKPVEINQEVLKPGKVSAGDSISFDALGESFNIKVDRTGIDVNGVYSIRGEIVGEKHDYFLLSSLEDRVKATLYSISENRKFSIKYNQGINSHLVYDIMVEDLDVLEPAPPLTPSDASREKPASYDYDYDNYGNTSAAAIVEDDNGDNNDGDDGEPKQVDIMIVYTPAAKEWAENFHDQEDAISMVINEEMENAQLVADNSEIDLNFELVYSSKVDYQEEDGGDDMGADLENLRGGEIEGVHEKRIEHGADLVAMFTKAHDAGGVAYQLNNEDGSPENGFSITRVQQPLTSYTFVHELGHNMGAHHHKEQNVQPGPGLFDYSAGWRWDSGGDKYCTVMTYTEGQYFEDGEDAVKVPYFSNPEVYYEDEPTGHEKDGDNARTIRETREVVSTYWDSMVDEVEFSISPEMLEMYVGDKEQIVVEVEDPEEDYTVEWESADEEVITVTEAVYQQEYEINAEGQGSSSVEFTIDAEGYHPGTETIPVKVDYPEVDFTVFPEELEMYVGGKEQINIDIFEPEENYTLEYDNGNEDMVTVTEEVYGDEYHIEALESGSAEIEFTVDAESYQGKTKKVEVYAHYEISGKVDEVVVNVNGDKILVGLQDYAYSYGLKDADELYTYLSGDTDAPDVSGIRSQDKIVSLEDYAFKFGIADTTEEALENSPALTREETEDYQKLVDFDIDTGEAELEPIH